MSRLVNIPQLSFLLLQGLEATMKTKDRNATGASVKSLYTEYNPSTFELIVYGADHWKYIDKGVKPGNLPPLGRILEWCVARGIPTDRANAIRWGIFHKGAPKTKDGKKIDQKKLNVVDATLKEILPELAEEVQKTAKQDFEAIINPLWQLQ